MAWRLAMSLETLRSEVNEMAPHRSKRSDGTLGDPAHASRASRHNPNRYDVVTALDLTHDPTAGCDIHGLARGVARDPHPELEYIISDGEVAKRRNGFRWERYYGDNQHRLHAHFAVGRGPDSDPMPPYDSTVSWFQQEADDMAMTPAERAAFINDIAGEVHKRVVLTLLAEDQTDDAVEVRHRDSLIGAIRRILGVPIAANKTDQPKMDAETGTRFQKLLGDG
jgi:hypothetical protein